jgi:hypothetical protein
MTSKNQSIPPSPLSNMDPLSQYYILMQNIADIKKNIDDLSQRLGLGSINGVKVASLTGISCDASKFITNKVCSLGNINLLESMYKKLDVLNAAVANVLPPQSQPQPQQGVSQFNYIINPETNSKVNIYSKKGQQIIKKYSKF